MMITVELLERIKIALAEDQKIRAWCLQTFDRVHTVYIGLDSQNLPRPEDDYPIIAVLANGQIRGSSQRGVSWEIMLGVGVHNDEIIEADNVKIMTGFGQMSALRELAENAIYAAKLGNTGSISEPVLVSGYPYFVSQFSIPIKQIQTSRHGLSG